MIDELLEEDVRIRIKIGDAPEFGMRVNLYATPDDWVEPKIRIETDKMARYAADGIIAFRKIRKAQGRTTKAMTDEEFMDIWPAIAAAAL